MFAPVEVPADFNPTRAKMSLAEIEPVREQLEQTEPPADQPLPATAQLRVDEAQRLFVEHRHAEALIELEQVFQVVTENRNALVLRAMASLLSGRDAWARQSAEALLDRWSADPVGHYVLGRLAQRDRDEAEALGRYRLALQCEFGQTDRVYEALTRYHLATLLDKMGYHAAAVEQFERFKSICQALGERVDSHPELFSILKVHRSTIAIRLARGYALLERHGAAADAMAEAVAALPDDIDLREEYVRTLVRASQLDEAARQARQLVLDTQGSESAVELLLAVHRYAGRPEAGVEVMREILERQPDNTELWLLYVDSLKSAGQHPEAIAELQRFLDDHPEQESAWWALAELQSNEGLHNSCMVTFARVLARQPAAYIRVGQMINTWSPELAGSLAEQFEPDAPENWQSVLDIELDRSGQAAIAYIIGRLALRAGQLEQADDFYQVSTEIAPAFLPGWIGQAGSGLSQCHWEETLALLEEAAGALDTPSHLLERLKGRCYEGLDKHDLAVEHYQQAIEIHPADTHTLMLLGDLFDRLGDGRQARRQYRSIIAVNPNDLRAREQYIRSLLNEQSSLEGTNRASQVAIEFNEMQRRNSDAMATRRIAALLQFLQTRDEQAYLEQLEGLIEAEPENTHNRMDLATVLLASRDYEPCLAQAEVILELEPNQARAAEIRSIALIRLLKWDQAAAAFDSMLACRPNRSEWLEQYAELQMARQAYASAVDLFKQLIELEDDTGQRHAIRNRLVEAYRMWERYDEARDEARKWLTDLEINTNLFFIGQSAARWSLLANLVAAGDHEAYLDQCRKWLLQREQPVESLIRSWYIGIEGTSPLPGTAGGDWPGPYGLIGLQRFDEAAAQISAWQVDEPENLELLEWQAEVASARGDFDQAIEIQQALLQEASRPEAKIVRLYNLQQVYVRAGRFEDAIATISLWQTTAEGMIADMEPWAQQQFEAAIFDQNRTVATLLARDGSVELALQHLDGLMQQIELPHGQVQILQTEAYIHQQQGDRDQALACLGRAYEIQPEDIGLNNDFGYSLADAGLELDRAEEMIRLALGHFIRQPAYQDSIGWVLYKQNKLEEARLWLERALHENHSQDAVIQDHLGDVYYRLEMRDEAVRLWTQARAAYDRDRRKGVESPEAGMPGRIDAKLQAIEQGAQVPVAPLGESFQPASSE
jgi:tetratricopeptide (TPR) repeat protein